MDCVATFFLSLERFLAVCCPIKYSVLNGRKYFLLSLVAAVLIGSLELIQLYGQEAIGVQSVLNETVYVFGCVDSDKCLFYRRYVAKVIVSVKIAIIISVVIFGIGIILKLHRRRRQVANMLSAEAALREHQEMVALCRFQMIDTICVVIDTILSLSWNMFVTLVRYYEDFPFEDECSYEAFVFIMNFTIVVGILNLPETVSPPLAHAELFPLYLLFHKKFRMAFVSMLKTCLKMISIPFSKMTTTQVTPLVVR